MKTNVSHGQEHQLEHNQVGIDIVTLLISSEHSPSSRKSIAANRVACARLNRCRGGPTHKATPERRSSSDCHRFHPHHQPTAPLALTQQGTHAGKERTQSSGDITLHRRRMQDHFRCPLLQSWLISWVSPPKSCFRATQLFRSILRK